MNSDTNAKLAADVQAYAERVGAVDLVEVRSRGQRTEKQPFGPDEEWRRSPTSGRLCSAPLIGPIQASMLRHGV